MDKTKRSRLGQMGDRGSNLRYLDQIVYATGAIAMGVPGWPEFAFWTPSIDKQRMVSTTSFSFAAKESSMTLSSLALAWALVGWLMVSWLRRRSGYEYLNYDIGARCWWIFRVHWLEKNSKIVSEDLLFMITTLRIKKKIQKKILDTVVPAWQAPDLFPHRSISSQKFAELIIFIGIYIHNLRARSTL